MLGRKARKTTPTTTKSPDNAKPHKDTELTATTSAAHASQTNAPVQPRNNYKQLFMPYGYRWGNPNSTPNPDLTPEIRGLRRVRHTEAKPTHQCNPATTTTSYRWGNLNSTQNPDLTLEIRGLHRARRTCAKPKPKKPARA